MIKKKIYIYTIYIEMTDPEPFVPANLRLGDDETYLVGVQRQNYVRINPNGGASGYTPAGTRQIEFNWNHGEAVDFAHSYLSFNIAYSANHTNMTLASDWISRVELYVDSQEIFTTVGQESRKLINLMLLGEVDGDWYQKEAKMFLGANLPVDADGTSGDEGTPYTTAPQSGPQTTRPFVVPLWIVHPAFAMSKVFPVLGSQIRMVLHLADADRCLNVRIDGDSTYTLNNVHLQECRVQLSPSYKQALMEQVNSEEGFALHMVDFDTIAHTVAAASSQNLVVRNEHRNAKTLVCYLDPVGRVEADADATHIAFNSPLATFTSKFVVNCGSLTLTGVNGSNSLAEHFAHLERANGSFANLSQSGLYDYRLYYGAATNGTRAMKNAGAGVLARWAASPLMCSLEKIQASDFDPSISNNGLSAFDVNASRELEVRIDTTAQMNPANERLYTALVFEKKVRLSNGVISVEH
jgi:hypothetical protein